MFVVSTCHCVDLSYLSSYLILSYLTRCDLIWYDLVTCSHCVVLSYIVLCGLIFSCLVLSCLFSVRVDHLQEQSTMKNIKVQWSLFMPWCVAASSRMIISCVGVQESRCCSSCAALLIEDLVHDVHRGVLLLLRSLFAIVCTVTLFGDCGRGYI